ncbi:MAG TPA: hypothetical protein VGK00_14480 [Anaerolineales bacterium]|jgi:hypothetical protein
MRNKLSIFIVIVAMLLLLTGFAPALPAQIKAAVANLQSSTPVPDLKIDVPAFSIQVNPPGANPMLNKADAQGRVAGALLGIWHGIISPITLIISFIDPSRQMYEVHNDGSPYNLGFLIGVALVFLFLGVFAGTRRR